jgi:O-acetyl-ADP-ribose deacetylase
MPQSYASVFVPALRPYEVVLEGWLTVNVNLGDITNEQVHAITNAANGYLQHAGGIAGAIVKKGG